MDAKDLRTEPALGDRSNDGNTKYPQGSAVLQCNRNKPYQDIGSNSLAKVDVQTSRPCAVIGPDRIVPPPISTNAYLKKGPPEPWLSSDVYRRPPEYPHKISDYQHPTRNISPRQTFQENMQRIMVPPSFNSVKLKEDHNFPVDSNTLRNKLNMPNEVKYCDVPYNVNPLSNEQKTDRNVDISMSNMNPTLARTVAPQGWPPGGANIRSSKPYGAPELYQYPEYSSCSGPRTMLMPRTHRTIHEKSGHVYSEPYYHEGSIRYKPYPPPVKERYPQARYEYIGNNYSNQFQPPPPFPTHKYDSPKPVPPHPYPGYSQVPLKYLEPRMADTVMNGYQRPLSQQTNFNAVPFRNQIIHTSYGPVPGNCLQTNKFYPYPPDNTKAIASNKLPYDTNSKFYAEYENTRPKPYPLPDSFFVNEVSRSHPIKAKVLPPSYPSVNLQAMPPYPYYRKENPTMKNYEFSPHFRNIDPTMNINVNPLSRLPSQFSPNAIAISPSDSNTSNDTTHTQATAHEDFGYVSQSSSTSIRSMDSGINKIPNDFYRRYDYRYGPIIKTSPLLSRPEPNPNSNIGSKNKKEIDVRQFLQMWNESEDENAESSNKGITSKAISAHDITTHFEASANQEQLYVLGLVNVPSEELGKYEHIQKVSKLPENIKGYNSLELLHQFEEVIESSNLNNFNVKPPLTQRDYHVSLKSSMLHGIRIPQRPISPLDVEAKISQSVIHKEVGCNFEIRPCSPKMLNVEVATPAQNLLGERVIEKVSNPLTLSSPILCSVDENMDTCNIVKHQDRRISSNENSKTSSCKMNSIQYSPDSVKTNYSLQDLESNSGVCLASLPRLDNDIELNFPEVNQQFINANKVDSVITSAPKDLPPLDIDHSNTVEDREVQDIKVGQFQPNIEFEKEFAKLSKYRKIKRKRSESKENTPEPNAQAMRTDSVIIKNPENNKSQEGILEQSYPPIKELIEDSQHNPINLIVQERVNSSPDHVVNDIIKDTVDNDIAIDFSLNSNDPCCAKNSVSENKANLSFSDATLASIEKHSNMPYLNYYSQDHSNEKVSIKNITKVIEDSNESFKAVEQTNFETDTEVVGGTNCLSNDETEAPSNVTAKSIKSHSNVILDNSDDGENLLHSRNSSDIEGLNKMCLMHEDSSGLNDILGSPSCVTVTMESVLSNVSSEKDVLFRDIKCKQNTTEETRHCCGSSENILNDSIVNESNFLVAKNKCNYFSTTIEMETAENGISLHFSNNKNCETKHKSIEKTKKVLHENYESICGHLSEIKCIENETTTSRFSKRVNKELFSPWFQKLVLHNEGLCASVVVPIKCSSGSVFPEKRKTILDMTVTTSSINKTKEIDTIDSLTENLETNFSDQDMFKSLTSKLDTSCHIDAANDLISDNIKNKSSVQMSTDIKDDPVIGVTDIRDPTCKQHLQNVSISTCSDEIMFDNEIYDFKSNNTRNDKNVNDKIGISVNEEIDNNTREEIVDNTTNETTSTNTCSTVSDSYVNNYTSSKLIRKTDPLIDDVKIEYSCSLSKTSDNRGDPRGEGMVDNDYTEQKLIETDSSAVDSFDSAINKSTHDQDHAFVNPVLKTTEFYVKNTEVDKTTRQHISDITGNDSFDDKEAVDSMLVKPVSKGTKTVPCVIATKFDTSSNKTLQSSEADNRTENSVVDKTIKGLTSNKAGISIDNASCDLISEPAKTDYFIRGTVVDNPTKEKNISETIEMDIDNTTSTSIMPKTSKTYFCIEDTVAANSTQGQINSDPTKSIAHVINSPISKPEPNEDTVVDDNTTKKLNLPNTKLICDVINTSSEVILKTTDDQTCIEDTLDEDTTRTLFSETTEIDVLLNKPNSEAPESDSYGINSKFNNTTDYVILEANRCVDNTTKELLSKTTEINQTVDDIAFENKAKNFISATVNRHSCSDSSQITETIGTLVDKTVNSDATEVNFLVDIIKTKSNLDVVGSDLCSTDEIVVIENTREPVSQVVATDNCKGNCENIPYLPSNSQNICTDVNKTIELNSIQNTYDTSTELNKFNPEEDSSICQIRYDELEAELDNSNFENISEFDTQRHMFPFINDTDSELKCIVSLKDVSSYRCEEPDTKVANKFQDTAVEATIVKKHRNDTDSADDTTTTSTIDENAYDPTFETPRELLEYCNLKHSEIDTCDAIPLSKSQLCDPFKYMRNENTRSLIKKRGTLKRSLSDSALYTCSVDFNDSSKHADSDNRPLLWPNKRKKFLESENSEARQFITEGYCNIIHHNRRNSLSAMYNEENVSFCILIDDNCIITEEDDETDKICFTDIPEDCISGIPNDSTSVDENTETEMSPNEEINCEYSDSVTLGCAEEEKSIDDTWVDDVACVETVVSDDIAENIIVSTSTSPRETDLSDDESNNNETSIFDVSDHTDKVKYIYGDKMCSNDAQLLETLYRTPQMDVNRTLVYKESQITEDCSRYYDKQTLEEVLSESSTLKKPTSSKLSENEFVTSIFSPDTINARKRILDAKDNIDLDNFNSGSSQLECKRNHSNINPDIECEKNEKEETQPVEKTQDGKVHSCESSVDNVFSYNQREESPKCTISRSPEVSSTTTEDKNAGILLKITNYMGSRTAQVSDNPDSKRNTVCCKYTENKEYLHFNTNLPSRTLITKAAQKYIPPLKETIPDLKIKLPLPPHSLIKLKQLKISKEEPKPNVKINNVNIGRKEIPKKSKPKFEDVLKSIEEIQFQMHKEKSKKIKKSIPKVVIKKIGNGSHYASTSSKDKYNPDLTGRKWQPWVFIERNSFIDKMALGKKTGAIFNHRKNKFVLTETFKKYRSIGSTKFVISQPRTDDSSLGQLKYTIKLKHSY